MLASAPAADVAGGEGPGYQDPRVGDDADPSRGSERYQDVEAAASALDPPLCRPVGQEARGRGAVEPEDLRSLCDCHSAAGRSV